MDLYFENGRNNRQSDNETKHLSVLAESSGKYSVVSAKGKVLAKNLNPISAVKISVSSDKADVYITQNKAGTKFGCFVVKAK